MNMNINENGDLLNEIVDNLEQIIQCIRDNLNNCKEKNNKINLEEEIDEKVDKKFLGEKRKYSEIFEDKENDKEQCEKNNNKRIKSKEILIELIKKIESVIIKINNKNNIIKNSNQEKVYSDGKYIGQIMNNLREGNGIMYYNNGDKFEGDWRKDKKYKGIHYYTNEPYKGDKYDGYFKDDKFEGEGIYYWKDGEKYEGYWKNGKREGKGIYYYNSGDKYIGYFSNDKEEDKGIYYFNDGDIYTGDFKEGEFEGKGIEYYTNGNKYEGCFVKGKAEGKGIYYYNNGDRYEGDFRKNKFEGKGVYYFYNGDREMGDYFNDEPIGKHVELRSNGDVEIKNY